MAAFMSCAADTDEWADANIGWALAEAVSACPPPGEGRRRCFPALTGRPGPSVNFRCRGKVLEDCRPSADISMERLGSAPVSAKFDRSTPRKDARCSANWRT